MPRHPMFDDDMREIVESFVVETRELFEALDADLVELERRPDDRELVNRIFRAVHTVKGTAGFLAFDDLSALAHRFEDVLNRLRRGELAFHPRMMDTLLQAFDAMKELLRQVENEALEETHCEPLLRKLEQIAAGTLPDPTPAAEAPPPPPPHAPAPPSEPTIRVDVSRLDHLMNLVGELVLGRNRLAQVVSGVEGGGDDAARELAEVSARIDSITTELQSAVMRTRMVQIGRLFGRFPRMVRDIAREFSKEIELVLDGEETELDRSVVEEIADPLVHLIRNAADHGIESPEARRRAGKPACGRIRLTAAHEGNHVVVAVEDDGAGIDPERLRAKAVEKGLLRPEEAAALGRAELFNLIFLPGFSTARQVSSLSGRGVGMDVVRTNVTRVNGTITVSSEVGAGTRIAIRLPLTVAIIQGLLVGVGEETFALPLHAVSEVVRIGDEVSTFRGREVIRLRERVLPLVRLGELLGVPARGPAGARYAVIVSGGHHTFGVLVDALQGQKEIVIKPLGTFLRKTDGIAGSTILGDGRVVMILDPARIAELAGAGVA